MIRNADRNNQHRRTAHRECRACAGPHGVLTASGSNRVEAYDPFVTHSIIPGRLPTSPLPHSSGIGDDGYNLVAVAQRATSIGHDHVAFPDAAHDFGVGI